MSNLWYSCGIPDFPILTDVEFAQENCFCQSLEVSAYYIINLAIYDSWSSYLCSSAILQDKNEVKGCQAHSSTCKYQRPILKYPIENSKQRQRLSISLVVQGANSLAHERRSYVYGTVRTCRILTQEMSTGSMQHYYCTRHAKSQLTECWMGWLRHL